MEYRTKKQEAIVLAPTWPSHTNGYGIAIRASLLLYLDYFSTVRYICLSDQSFTDMKEWPSSRIEWNHISIVNRPMWVRFLRSLTGVLPAVTVRYSSVRHEVMNALRSAIQKNSSEMPFLIIEDIPLACFLEEIRQEFPDLPIALRSHDMMEKAYGDLRYVGTPIHRLCWRLEIIRIHYFEKKVCKEVDRFWTISSIDRNEYINRLSVKPNGVLGV